MPYTVQQTFDIVAKHLLTQNKRAAGPIGCMYRGANGTKCAIGALLPDEMYLPKLEGKAACQLLDTLPQFRALFEPGAQAILDTLQAIHDGTEPFYWRKRLLQFAETHTLNTDVLNQTSNEG